MLIQIILIVGVGLVVGLAMRAPAGARHLALRRIAVIGFALLAVLSILFPDAWNAAAALVGVGRGTDLLLYGLIVVFLVYMVTTYRRFRDMEQQVTQLARRIAIDEALATFTPDPGPPPGADGAATSPTDPTPLADPPRSPQA